MFAAVFLTGLAPGLGGSGAAILVATLTVYVAWALTFYRRRVS